MTLPKLFRTAALDPLGTFSRDFLWAHQQHMQLEGRAVGSGVRQWKYPCPGFGGVCPDFFATIATKAVISPGRHGPDLGLLWAFHVEPHGNGTQRLFITVPEGRATIPCCAYRVPSCIRGYMLVLCLVFTVCVCACGERGCFMWGCRRRPCIIRKGGHTKTGLKRATSSCTRGATHRGVADRSRTSLATLDSPGRLGCQGSQAGRYATHVYSAKTRGPTSSASSATMNTEMQTRVLATTAHV